MDFMLKPFHRIKYIRPIPTFHIIRNMRCSTTALRQANEGKHTTVNIKEIQAFSKNSHLWWDLKSSLRGLHTFNKIRVPFVTEGLARQDSTDLQNANILDVGCGGGILSEALAMSGVSVTGIDACKEAIDVAIQHSNNNQNLRLKPEYYCTTIEEHVSEYSYYYDGVVASEIIEHIDNKELFVKACVEALKPGGRIFFTTPAKTRLSQIVNIWFSENVMGLPPKGSHQYSKFISPSDLQNLLEFSKYIAS